MVSATFLLCAESGHFEAQTLLAIECLRHFGGKFANCPVLVVTPRLGPSLMKATLKRFRELDVKYVSRRIPNRYVWYPYTNKALAALMGDEIATSEQLIWLDSDVLVVNDLNELVLGASEDFAICSVDKNIGSAGPDDPYEAYWAEMARQFGVPLDSLPWITPSNGSQRVRFRLHSGVYAMRREIGIGQAFVEAMDTMLRSRIIFSRRLPYPGDDVALAFAMVQHRWRYRILPISCNQEIVPASTVYRPDEISTSAVLHYHRALTDASQTPWLFDQLELHRPDVAQWLRPRMPIDSRMGGAARRAIRRVLYEVRQRAARHEAALSRPMVADGV